MRRLAWLVGVFDRDAGLRRLTLLVAAALLTVAAAAPSASASTTPGTTGNVQKCGLGGWQTWVRADGSSFANMGLCVAYASAGGTLMLPQKVTFTSAPPAHGKVGTTYAVSATGGGSGQPVVFTIAGASSSVCSIAGTAVTFRTLGTCVVDANQNGSGVYLPATQTQQSVTVDTKGDQTVAFGFGSPGTIYLAVAGVSPAYAPTATATTGFPVAITLDASSAGCSLSAGAVTFTSDGVCVIDANQSGDANWNAAPQVQQAIQVYTGQSLVDLDQATLTSISQGTGDVPLNANVATLVNQALTIANDVTSLSTALGHIEIGVGLMAQALGRTFTPSTGGIPDRVDAINAELDAQQNALTAISQVDPTTQTLDQLQTQITNLQTYSGYITNGFSDPIVFSGEFAVVGIDLQDLINTINALTSESLRSLPDGITVTNDTLINIGDMFDVQFLLNPVGPLVELADSVVSADNTAITSMCRNCKG